MSGDKIEQLEHAKKCYLRDLEPENLAIIRKSFGLQVMCKRRDWLKHKIKEYDEEIECLKKE
nr:MAG TPA: hypothetical protein [Siphoviridae sp. ctSIv21]